jgi:hypothetical protein
MQGVPGRFESHPDQREGLCEAEGRRHSRMVGWPQSGHPGRFPRLWRGGKAVENSLGVVSKPPFGASIEGRGAGRAGGTPAGCPAQSASS